MAYISPVDSMFDRYSRVFMALVLALTSILMVIEYHLTKLECEPPKTWTESTNQINTYCWSSGMFLYDEIIQNSSIKTENYGFPDDVTLNGMVNITGELCNINSHQDDDWETCQPMKRVYFKEYQWLPFYFGSLPLLFLLPYVMFKMVNHDLYSLHKLVSSNCNLPKASVIVQSYFDRSINVYLYQTLRGLSTGLVKMAYVAVNVFALTFTAFMLKGDFKSYGSDVNDWDNRNKSANIPHPGMVMLPTIALCGIKKTFSNFGATTTVYNVVFPCHVSVNVFYQNVLLFHWYIFVFGITISVTGLVAHIGRHVVNLFLNPNRTSTSRRPQAMITLRGMEYLDLIKEQNIALYGEVLREWNRANAKDDGKYMVAAEDGDVAFSL